jgi:hypothetical protein
LATEATGQVPDPREGDPEPHPKRIVIFRTGVPEENLRPWRVLITTPGGDRPYIDELVVGPEYYTRVLVDANSTAVITVEVKPARKGSKRGFCTIGKSARRSSLRYGIECIARWVASILLPYVETHEIDDWTWG